MDVPNRLRLAVTLPLSFALAVGCPGPEKTPPTAAFSASPIYGETPLDVLFTDATIRGTADITSWQWDFGDGGTSTAPNPNHTYTGANTYSVSLTVASAHGSDTSTRADYITTVEPGGPTIAPMAGEPGSKVTITGDGFDGDDPTNNVVYFGDESITVTGATSTELTTAVPALVDPGAVAVRVEVSGVTAASGLPFEILPPSALVEPPGAVAEGVRNDVAEVVATTVNLLTPLIDLLDEKSAEEFTEALGVLDMLMGNVEPLLDYAQEEGELELLDQIFLSSGFADEIGDINEGLKKRMAKVAEMDALEQARAQLYGKVAVGPGAPARHRFVLDWLAARFHLAMEFANVAMVALATAASFTPGTPALYTFGGAVAVAGVFMGALNMVYVAVEASPIELDPSSLTGRVGETNVVATETTADVVFEGDFVAETNTQQVVLALFFPGFSQLLEMPDILAEVFSNLASELLSHARPGQADTYIIPPLPPQTDVPIYTFEFMDGLIPNPPEFDGAPYAALDVAASRITTYDEETSAPIPLTATQEVHRFQGGFFKPLDPPRIEHETAEHEIPVEVKRGLVIEVDPPDPPDPLPPPGDPVVIVIRGRVTKWDGSPVDDGEITVTIRVGNQVITTTTSGGEFEEGVTVPTGENDISVTADDGRTSATGRVTYLNYVLPATYCVVTNVLGHSVSLIDPAENAEFALIESSEVGGIIDRPRDAVFLPNGETLIVLDSVPGEPGTIYALQLSDLVDIRALGDALVLGNGNFRDMALASGGEAVVATCYDDPDDISAIYVIDVRRPDYLIVADVVEFTPYDLYGPIGVDTGTSPDGRAIALVTIGFYQDIEPSDLVVLDITNPYNVAALGTVEVASTGGAVATVPGAPLAVVAGVSDYDGGSQVIDSAVEIVDFSNPAAPVVRDTLHRDDTFALGLAVMPDGATALVGDPGGGSNKLLLFDIGAPDAIAELGAVSPLPFGGIGALRLAVSPDGRYAVTTNNLSDTATAFDVSDIGAPAVAGPLVPVGDPLGDTWPFGVTFRP